MSQRFRLTGPLIIPLMSLVFALSSATRAESDLTYSDQIWNFGHIGIDFEVFHTYWMTNGTDKPIKIEDVVVSCDCSRVRPSDTVIRPGDTVYFRLAFQTKDYYGAMNRSFKVMSDSPTYAELKFHYTATVGQWFYGIKPEPISLFFLPAHTSKEVKITNEYFDKISVSVVEQANEEMFTTRVKKPSAKKREALVLEVQPSEDIGAGTFRSSLTVSVETSGSEKPALLTIPVKIVRY